LTKTRQIRRQRSNPFLRLTRTRRWSLTLNSFLTGRLVMPPSTWDTSRSSPGSRRMRRTSRMQVAMLSTHPPWRTQKCGRITMHFKRKVVETRRHTITICGHSSHPSPTTKWCGRSKIKSSILTRGAAHATARTTT
jgi:hypothetical protein